MLTLVQQVNYVIILCDDMERMKAFYRELFAFPVDSESDTSLAFRAGSVLFALRKRTRGYDGSGVRAELPGVQIAFLVAPHEVDLCYAQLVEKGVEILEPPTDQPRGHRTVYFSDPEGNMLEIYAEIEPFAE
jgi:catechol 2,3-dioxygenase-like lactoylglutathione lyase family enzyme